MRVVEKTHHIDITISSGSGKVLPLLRQQYPHIQVVDQDDDNELVPVEETDVYKEGIFLFQIPGNRLYAYRSRKGLSQKALAESVGIKREAISMLETGKRSLGVNLAKKLAPPLGVDYKDLLPDE